MRRIIVRSQQRPDNDINKKRHSTLAIDNDNEEEHSSQPQCLTLLTNKLGIPPDKAEQACVATSFRSAQAAVDWLLQRHDDGKIVRREYILLLCPDERLNEQIRTFTGEANQYLINDSTSKDRQHLRAFKMSNFFHISDRYVYTFYKTIDVALRRFRNLNFPSTRINLHSTSDCLMLVPDGESKKMLEDLFETIKLLFGQAAPEVTVLPSRQPLHLTLAHGLHTSSLAQRSSLIALARVCIDFERVIDWQLRLYSREQSSTTAEIYRVIVPTSLSECLSLKLNDLFVVLDNNRLGEQALVFGEQALIKFSLVFFFFFCLGMLRISSLVIYRENDDNEE